MLSDLTVYLRLYSPPYAELWEQGRRHQTRLVETSRSGAADAARSTMTAPMQTAQRMIEDRKAEMPRRFLPE